MLYNIWWWHMYTEHVVGSYQNKIFFCFFAFSLLIGVLFPERQMLNLSLYSQLKVVSLNDEQNDTKWQMTWSTVIKINFNHFPQKKKKSKQQTMNWIDIVWVDVFPRSISIIVIFSRKNNFQLRLLVNNYNVFMWQFGKRWLLRSAQLDAI